MTTTDPGEHPSVASNAARRLRTVAALRRADAAELEDEDPSEARELIADAEKLEAAAAKYDGGLPPPADPRLSSRAAQQPRGPRVVADVEGLDLADQVVAIMDRGRKAAVGPTPSSTAPRRSEPTRAGDAAPPAGADLSDQVAEILACNRAGIRPPAWATQPLPKRNR